MRLKAVSIPENFSLKDAARNALWLYDASNAVPSAPFAWMEPQIPVASYAYIPANQMYKGIAYKGTLTKYFIHKKSVMMYHAKWEYAIAS